ncbi:MAG: hypothetical protein AAF639_23600 [Chloroflexota bacterium]
MATKSLQQTIPKPRADKRPYFFWDYDMTNEQINQIIQNGSLREKAWVINRILQYAKWEDIWFYLTPNDIRQVFEHLRFRRIQDRVLWSYALQRWAINDS